MEVTQTPGKPAKKPQTNLTAGKIPETTAQTQLAKNGKTNAPVGLTESPIAASSPAKQYLQNLLAKNGKTNAQAGCKAETLANQLLNEETAGATKMTAETLTNQLLNEETADTTKMTTETLVNQLLNEESAGTTKMTAETLLNQLLKEKNAGTTKMAAEDFERYGEKLKAEYESRAAEPAKKQPEEEFKTLELPAEWKAMYDAVREQNKIMLEFESERLREQYGDLTNYEMTQVLKAERELTICANCSGLPCNKNKNRCMKPQIKYYDDIKQLSIAWCVCKYENARRTQNTLSKKYGLARIPAEYVGATFDDYRVDANNRYAVEIAQRLLDLPDKGAYFFGNVGTGKTFLAAIFAQEQIRRGRHVIFATLPTISMQIRSTFNEKNGLTESAILEKLFTVPVLIIDDVGMEKPTRFVCSMLGNIFNERYNARLQTIMTSNYPLKHLEYIFNHPTDGEETFDGSRIYDRCKQMCCPVELKGNSRRR